MVNISGNIYIGYVERIEGDGWLQVKFDDSGMVWPIPEYLKVSVTESNGRENFTILEGRFMDRTASVKRKGWQFFDWDGSYFESGIPHKQAAEMTFFRKSEKLEITGLGTFKAITQPDNPVPLGTSDLEIPYEPHRLGLSYIKKAQYAKTWFRVGHSGDRFLHCGRVSAGCITVTEYEKWDLIYNHLILARKDAYSIGTVKVLET